MNDTKKATVRTTVNTTVLAAICALVYQLFGWSWTVDDLLPYVGLVAPVVAVFYRLSLWASKKWPTVGYILFGINEQPTYDS